MGTGVSVSGGSGVPVGGGSGVLLGTGTGVSVETGVLVGTNVLVGTGVLEGISVAVGMGVAVSLGAGVIVGREVAVRTGDVTVMDGRMVLVARGLEESVDGSSWEVVSGRLPATGGCAMKASTSSIAAPLFSKVILIYLVSCAAN